jgi:hypothetical protein
VRTAIYVRLEDPRHELLMEYATAQDLTLNVVVERLVDQLLIQMAPDKFTAPEWLVTAIIEGHIPLSLPDPPLDDDEIEPECHVVKRRGAR